MTNINRSKTNIILIQLDSFTDLKYTFFNPGILSIATLLKKSGYSVCCKRTGDLSCVSYERIKDFFTDSQPEIVGFNINSDNIMNVKYMAGDIKKWLPGTTVLVGGPLVSIMKDRLLDEKCIDMAIYGEGEFPTLKLCDKIIKNQGEYSDITGLIYRDIKGTVKINSQTPQIEDLDILPPPDYSLLGFTPCRYKTPGPNNPIFYSSGRGCPFSCSFCFQGVHGKGYRYFSAQRVIKDIMENCEKYKSTSVCIIDDTFIANPARTTEICNGIKQQKKLKNLDFSIWCEGRIDTFYRHPQLLEKLKSAGLVKLQLGIENGNQQVLDLYNKKITLEQIEFVVGEIARTKGIVCFSNFIIGGPFETEETAAKSLEFALKLMNMAPGLFEADPAFLCPYPGTDIARHPEKYGLTIVDDEWYKSLSVQSPSCITGSLGIDDLMRIRLEYLNSFNNERLKILKKLDYDTVKFHIELKSKYGFETYYYNTIKDSAPVIIEYLLAKNSDSRFRIREMQRQTLEKSRPVRMIQNISYTKGRQYLLNGYLEPVYIKNPLEMEIYDYSNGKHSIAEIAGKLKSGLNYEITENRIIDKYILPFYRKLENSYHILFQI